jgi:hypothetical protein
MKKILLGIGILLLAASGYAQNEVINNLFEKYSGTEGITLVNISGDMLNMMTKAEMEKRDTVIQSKLSEVRILALSDDCENKAQINLKTEVLDKLDKSVYKEMIRVKQTDEDVVIMMKEANGHVSEVLIVVGGSNDNALIQIKGDIMLSELSDLMGKYPMKGFDHFR